MPISRRRFLKTTAASTVLAATPAWLRPQNSGALQFVSQRPAPGARRFRSAVIDELIRDTQSRMADPELAWMFGNCFPNTLDTTVTFHVEHGVADTFVITGDIEAMWLRDSTAQVWPYLPYIGEDPDLRSLMGGVIRRQTRCILIDPYANAFNEKATGSYWESDITAMRPELHERKWEIDSLCYPIRLAYAYWKKTRDTEVFDANWQAAMRLVVETFRTQQRKDGPGPYTFMRKTQKAEDTVPLWGRGNPINPVGMICSTFRPSDDACVFPFLVPSNLFAVKSLRQLANLWEGVVKETGFATECRNLAIEVETAVQRYGVVEHPDFGRLYAYEVDGFGSRLLMDDANVPSLLSLPYLGLCAQDDPLYQTTRRFVWGPSNPYFFKGQAGEGIGGPHVGMDHVWPMSLIMRALTSADEEEIRRCLSLLKKTHAGTGFMHESFHKDDASRFTRKWFAWANTLFGELILRVARRHPGLLQDSNL